MNKLMQKQNDYKNKFEQFQDFLIYVTMFIKKWLIQPIQVQLMSQERIFNLI